VPTLSLTASGSGTITDVAIGILTSQISDIEALNPDAADIYIWNATTGSPHRDVELLSGASCTSFTTSGAYTYYNCLVPSGVVVNSGDTISVEYNDEGAVFPYGVDIAAAEGATLTYASGAHGSATSNPDQPFIMLASSAITMLPSGPGPAGPTGVFALIASSSASFSAAYGFPVASTTAWASTWFLDIVGSGLGVLVQLLPYIIGLAVIGAIVYFLYRAFRFFRH
jgi:hypothetical protein